MDSGPVYFFLLKNSGVGKNGVQTDGDGEAFELEESYFPPLPGTEVIPKPFRGRT